MSGGDSGWAPSRSPEVPLVGARPCHTHQTLVAGMTSHPGHPSIS